jgi:hypothetical protein
MALNASGTRQQYRLDVAPLNWQDGRIVRDLITGEELIVSGSELVLTLEAWTGVWVV